MKYFVFLIVFLVLNSCTENDTKTDRETNTYYAQHKYIYDNRDSLGVEKSLALIDEYTKEFPNAKEIYKLKAHILALDGQYTNCEEVLLGFEKEYDKSLQDKMETRDYLISLLLMDSSNVLKAKSIMKTQEENSYISLDNSYNLFWIALYEKNYEVADSLTEYILTNEKLEKNYHKRMDLVGKAAQQDTSYVQFYMDSFNLKPNVKEMIDSLSHDWVSLSYYYKKLSK